VTIDRLRGGWTTAQTLTLESLFAVPSLQPPYPALGFPAYAGVDGPPPPADGPGKPGRLGNRAATLTKNPAEAVVPMTMNLPTARARNGAKTSRDARP